MKTALMTCFSVLAALATTGCPVYPSDNQCHSDWDCASGYFCNGENGSCVLAGPAMCRQPTDCRQDLNEVCAKDATCRVGSCHLADIGCVAGFSCVGADPDKAWTCIPTSAVVSAGGSSSVSDAGTPGGSMFDAGTTGGSMTDAG